MMAFLLRSEPRRPLSAWAFAVDVVIAAAATVGAIVEVLTRARDQLTVPAGTTFIPATINVPGMGRLGSYAAVLNGQVIGLVKRLPQDLPPLPLPSTAALAGIALTAAPLAFRRRYPVAAGCVVLGAIFVIRTWTPPVAFATGVLAAYSAVVYSRYRQLAVGTVLILAAFITATFPNTLPRVSERYSAILVVIPTVAAGIGMREWRRRAGDSAERLRRAQAEHQAATRRAIATERARIASELHDVVTHNVSVMIVQAGAARQVLAISPADAREALLAVEAGGRTAMAELRHLLGLLCPVDDGSAGGEAADAESSLRPQPGLSHLGSLIDRVSAAGPPIKLRVTGERRDLPPGLDLAAYRVVQEALTNVVKHAGQAPTSIHLNYQPDELVIDVTNDRPSTGSPGPGPGGGVDGPGAARGLIGLRERVALYGGTLDAGPRPSGGWRVRAQIPFYAPGRAEPDDVLSGASPATA